MEKIQNVSAESERKKQKKTVNSPYFETKYVSFCAANHQHQGIYEANKT